MEFGRNKYDVVSRGGKGHEAVKRLSFVRVVPPPIELVDWDKVEGKEEKPRPEAKVTPTPSPVSFRKSRRCKSLSIERLRFGGAPGFGRHLPSTGAAGRLFPVIFP